MEFALEPLDGLDGLDGLERRWRRAASRAPAVAFLGWTWISAWMAATGLCPVLLRGRDGSGAEALGLLCRARLASGRVVLALNEAAEPELAAPWIEHNGLAGLAPGDPRVEDAARFLAATRLEGPLAGWHELRLGGVAARWAPALARAGLAVRLRSVQQVHAIDLAGLRARGGGIDAALRGSARAALRRSMRLYAARGPLVLEPAHGLAALDELVALHQARWRARGEAGAFAAPVMARFARELLARGEATGEVELLRARCGGRTIAMLLHLVAGDTASSYLSGVALEEDNRLKPGLVAHALAASAHLARGTGRYDLLAGGVRHKAALALPAGALAWISARPRGVVAALRDGAERLRARVAGRPG